MPRPLFILLGGLLAVIPGWAASQSGQLSVLTTSASTPSAGVEYRIDPQQSAVNIFAYSRGVLAEFAHNHVMTTGSLSGSVAVDGITQHLVFELSFPVRQLIIDDPEARSAAGADFPPDITDADRAATRRIMLGRDVMDAQSYPTIMLQSVRTSGPQQPAQLMVRITIKGVTRELPIVADVQFQDAALKVSGEFDILQTDFGIKPFSMVFGALRIEDRLRVKFAVHADRM